MNFSEFKAGKYERKDDIECFIPSKINENWTWDDGHINLLLSKAGYYLGQLNAMTRYLPNAKLFYSMAMFKEAVESNEIEGTKSELKEVIVNKEKNEGLFSDVMNYVEAAELATKLESGGGLSEKLLCEIHGVIVGKNDLERKTPSTYKEKQNWIGGSTKYDARFIPAPPDEVVNAMKDLFEFLNGSNDVPDLVKIGIGHYQFETIHPFNDGNGRLGRLLIPMYLIDKKILSYPLFISHFFSEQRRDYYDNLDRVRSKDEITHWIKFFLLAIKSSAKKAIQLITDVNELQKTCEADVKKVYGAKSTNAEELLKLIFREPIINSKQIVKELGITSATTNSILANFVELGILDEMTGQKRNRQFIFNKYFKVLLEKEASEE